MTAEGWAHQQLQGGEGAEAMVTVCKGCMGSTGRLWMWGRGGESRDNHCSRNKTGHCIKGTIQHNL